MSYFLRPLPRAAFMAREVSNSQCCPHSRNLQRSQKPRATSAPTARRAQSERMAKRPRLRRLANAYFWRVATAARSRALTGDAPSCVGEQP